MSTNKKKTMTLVSYLILLNLSAVKKISAGVDSVGVSVARKA